MDCAGEKGVVLHEMIPELTEITPEAERDDDRCVSRLKKDGE
jgi:hypothetical protein